MKSLCICLFFLPCITASSDNNSWTLRKDKDGISIFSRHSETSKYNDLRIEVDLPGTPVQLASVLLDVQHYPGWAYAFNSTVMVKKVSSSEVIYYSKIDIPWPGTDRDFYADLKLNMDPTGRSLNVQSDGMKNYQPENKDLVRIPMSHVIWTVTAESDKVMHLHYILQMDPGGSVPAWILNAFCMKAPMETFTALKRRMTEMNK
jgi:START domain